MEFFGILNSQAVKQAASTSKRSSKEPCLRLKEDRMIIFRHVRSPVVSTFTLI